MNSWKWEESESDSESESEVQTHQACKREPRPGCHVQQRRLRRSPCASVALHTCKADLDLQHRMSYDRDITIGS